jgi:hypothetical protein
VKLELPRLPKVWSQRIRKIFAQWLHSHVQTPEFADGDKGGVQKEEKSDLDLSSKIIRASKFFFFLGYQQLYSPVAASQFVSHQCTTLLFVGLGVLDIIKSTSGVN